MGVLVLQGFVLTPLYLLHLGPSLYGAWLALSNILSWVSSVDPGVARITSQRVASSLGAGNTEKAFQAFYDGLAVALLLGAVPFILSSFAAYPASFFELAGVEQSQLTAACRWSLFNIFLVLLDGPVWALVRGMQRPLFLGAAQLVSALAGILACAYLLLYGGFGVASLPMGVCVRVVVELSAKLVFLLWIPTGLRSFRPRPPTARKVWQGFLSYRAGFGLVVGNLLRTQFTYFWAAKFVSPQAAAVLALSGQALHPLEQLIDRTIQAPMAAFAHLVGDKGHAGVGGVFGLLRDYCAVLVFVGVAGTVALNYAFVSNWVGVSLFGGPVLTCLLSVEMGLAMTMLTHQEMLFAMGAFGQIGRVRLFEGGFKTAAQALLCLCIGLPGIPLAGILSAAIMRLGLIPLLEARYIGCTVPAAREAALQEFLRIAFAVVCGLAGWNLALLGSADRGWLPFAFAAGIAGLVYSMIALAVFSTVRFEIFKMARHFFAGLLAKA